jgi:hypothetical protein
LVQVEIRIEFADIDNHILRSESIHLKEMPGGFIHYVILNRYLIIVKDHCNEVVDFGIHEEKNREILRHFGKLDDEFVEKLGKACETKYMWEEVLDEDTKEEITGGKINHMKILTDVVNHFKIRQVDDVKYPLKEFMKRMDAVLEVFPDLTRLHECLYMDHSHLLLRYQIGTLALAKFEDIPEFKCVYQEMVRYFEGFQTSSLFITQ